jgi:hypothetical protein
VLANILLENTKVFYVPCGSRNLNVHVGDVTKSSVTALNIFGTLQEIYTTFAVSTSLWGIKKHAKHLSQKPLLETRSVCCTESAKLYNFKFQVFKLF